LGSFPLSEARNLKEYNDAGCFVLSSVPGGGLEVYIYVYIYVHNGYTELFDVDLMWGGAKR
jgi:hypothetical protein